jgi:uncharacterized protein YbjT (DUF2867 family)
MNDKILITGATGKQGGSIIRHLLKHDGKIRAMTRDDKKAAELKKMGVEVVIGDLLDRPSIDAALRGIKRMYLVTTPYDAGGVESEVMQGLNGVEAAADAGVEHLVFSSVGSAQRDTGIPHFESKRKTELKIAELGLKSTILRPVFFMENLGSPWFLPALKNGVIAIPMRPDRKLAMVALDNIGEYGANAFLHPDKYIGEEIELAGDEITFPNALGLISKATSRKIDYLALPYEDAEKTWGNDAATMYIWFDKIGYNPDIPMLETKYGFRLTRFAEYLKSAPWLAELRTGVKVN